MSGLKPGQVTWVIRVTFCGDQPVRPRLLKYPGLIQNLALTALLEYLTHVKKYRAANYFLAKKYCKI